VTRALAAVLVFASCACIADAEALPNRSRRLTWPLTAAARSWENLLRWDIDDVGAAGSVPPECYFTAAANDLFSQDLDNFSWSFWYRADENPPLSTHVLFERGCTEADPEQPAVGQQNLNGGTPGDGAAFFAWGSFSHYCRTDDGAFVNGSWQHLVFTYDGTQPGNDGKMDIYVDGVSQGLTCAGTVGSALTNCTEDVNSKGIENMTGFMDEFSWYASTLSSANVTALYNAGTPVDPRTLGLSNMIAYWRMGDRDTSPTVVDVVNGLNLTLTGCTNFSTTVPP